jgi:hypothetical protein
VYALSKKLALDDGASPQEFRDATDRARDRDQVVASGFLSGCYPSGCNTG